MIYDRYGDHLFDFAAGMLRDRNEAADVVQDVFLTAAQRLPQLREAEKLRPWLYAVCRHETLRRVRSRRREHPVDELPDSPASWTDAPEEAAKRSENAALLRAAAAGLSERDRAVLDLNFRQGLEGGELAEALGGPATNAHQMLHRARPPLRRSIEALIVAQRAPRDARNLPP